MNPRSCTDDSSASVVDVPHRSALLTLLFTDVVDSVRLKEEHGDRRALRLLEKHDAVLRTILAEHPDSREAQVAGDSFCLVFPRPSEAVLFAISFQRALRELSVAEGVTIRDRIGIHVGEVLLTDEGPHARPIAGMQIDTCARIMSLGAGDQILVSRFVFDSARQSFRGEIAERLGALAWLNHGLYEFKGVGEPMEVFEIGEVGVAQLAPPAGSAKVHRLTNADGECVRGWRPAPGVTVPGTSWALERSLGEGGFGEVWLATHRILKEQRVFKFCFQLNRVRSLKREITLLRILREKVGEHPGIVRLHDVFLDEPPYYLAMDFVSGGSLTDWAEREGGLAGVPLAQRLEIVIQVADALGAAHDAGVIHRDVKPGNVLISQPASGTVRAHLSDFGIGQIIRDSAAGSVTQLGFTQTLSHDSSGTGTPQYMAPELHMGRAASPESDVYSLGVLLFQLIIGDLQRPVTGDWQEEISDPLLREDLRKCLASDPARRWSSANQVAARLRALPERRANLLREEARLAAAERNAYRRGVLRSAAVGSIIVLLLATFAGIAVQQARRAERHAAAEGGERARAESALTRMQLQRADELLGTGQTRDGLAYLAHVVRRDPGHRAAAARLLSTLCDRAHSGPLTPPMAQPGMVVDVAFRPDGRHFASTGPGGTQIWNTETGEPTGELIPFGGYRVAWSPDGARLAVMRFDAHIYDAATRKLLLELDSNPSESSGTARPEILLNNDWTQAVTAAAHETVEHWDVATGKRLGSPMRHPSEVWSIALQAEQGRILAGCADGNAHLWSIPESREVQTFQMPARVTRVAFHPDGKHVLTGCADGSVGMWNAESGALIHTMLKHDGEITDLVFSPCDSFLVVADQGGGCRFYDASTLKPAGKPIDDRYRVWGAQFSANGLAALTRTGEGLVRLWNVAERKESAVPIQPDGFPLAARFSPDGLRIVTGCSDGNVQVWDASARAAEPLLLPHGAQIWQAAFQPGADRAVTGGRDGMAQVWELQSGKPAAAPVRHGGGVERVRFEREGTLLTAGADHFVRVWDREGQPLGKPLYLDANTSASELMPGRNEILLAADGGSAQLWDLHAGKPGATALGKRVWSAVTTRDGKRILLADDTRAVLYNREGKLAIPEMPHRGKVSQAIFSPTERLISTGSYDGSAQLWDATTGNRVGPEMRHANVVSAVSWSCDEKLLATSCYERSVHIWNPADSQRAGAPLLHPDMVTHIAFSPTNPRHLLTGSIDGHVRLWDLESRLLIAADWVVPGKVQAIQWNEAGTRVLAFGENTDVAQVWTVHSVPDDAASWLPDWAEAAGRRRLGADGSLQEVAFAEIAMKRAALSARAKAETSPAALRWAFGERPRSTLSPDFPLSLPDASRALVASTSGAARAKARSLAPHEGAIWVSHLLNTLRGEGSSVARTALALDFETRHALSLTSGTDAGAWLARSMVLDAKGLSAEADNALLRGLTLAPDEPALLRRTGERAVAAGKFTDAVTAFSQGLRMAGDDTPERQSFLLARSAALRSAGKYAEAGADNLLARGLASRRPDAPAQQIDLSAFYNCRLDEDMMTHDRDNTLGELKPGLHTLAGTTFDIRGLVQLGNREQLKRFPREVRGIPVGQTCQRLLLLQAAEFATEEPGGALAQLVIHYEDGQEEVVPQLEGRDIADWWTPNPAAPLVPAWRGSNPFSRAKGGALCLFKATWENPRPEVAIRSLDYVSVAKKAAPFVVAITAE